MPITVTKTYGKRSSALSNATLKRKPTSELIPDDSLPASSDVASEKRRKLEPSSLRREALDNEDGSKASSPAVNAITINNSGQTSPTKLSKRMLRRSKTETSIPDSDHSPSRDTRRTPSLPIIPSPSSPHKEQRMDIASPLRATTTFPSLPSVVASSSTSAPTTFTSSMTATINSTTTFTLSSVTRTSVTRTYAGNSRSFLMPLSSFTGGDSNGLQQSQGDDLDDEFSRESYASLRQRWGVDDTSEDDPYYEPIPLHSQRSNSGGTRAQTPSSASPSPSKSRAKNKSNSSSHVSPMKSRSRSNGGRSPSKNQLPAPPPLPSNMMNPLKSITELRNKGESRRFLDEVAYLLDGMVLPYSGAPNMGLVRASAHELITKLSDSAEFSRKAKAADIYGRVYDLMVNAGAGTGVDKVLDTLLLTFLTLLARDHTSLREVGGMYPASSLQVPVEPNSGGAKGKDKAIESSSTKSVVDVLFNLIGLHTSDEEEDILPSDPLILVSNEIYTDAHLKRAGIGKREKGTLATLLSALRSQSILSIPNLEMDGQGSLSTPSVAVALLHALPPSLLPANTWRIGVLVNSLNVILKRILRHVQTINSTRASKKTPLTRLDAAPADYHALHLHLRLVDLYLLGQWTGVVNTKTEDESPYDQWDAVVESIAILGGAVTEDDGFDDDDADDKNEATRSELVDQCLEALLRVLVTLTHAEGKWAARVTNTSALSWLTTLVKEAGDDVRLGDRSDFHHHRQTNSGNGKDRNRQKSGEDTETEAADSDSGSEGDELTAAQRRQQKRIEGRARALDRLCLSLALLTNLVQNVEDVGDLMRDAGTLEVLARVYEQQGQISDEAEAEHEQAQADAAFLRGHLSVLFGLVMQGNNEETQDVILSLLPRRGESKQVKLNRLVDQAQRFVSFFDADEKGEKKVAQEVVRFLEDLRDK